jgi:antitoxin ChpS
MCEKHGAAGLTMMTSDERKALHQFVDVVRRHYGARVYEILLFGSRARGDDAPDSDADVAVILQDGPWRFWHEKMVLAGFAYDALIDVGLSIQAWPITRSAWEIPSTHHNRLFIEEIKRDARKLPEAA